MTEKQELILVTALRLFAEKGFDTTPTSLIAKEAGVSEGLIFRHFTNKDGLMDAIVAMSEERLSVNAERILQLSNPIDQIHATLELPVKLFQEEREFWMLQFSLKWQKKYKNQTYTPSPAHLKVIQALTDGFRALGYAQPEQEVKILMMLLDGFSHQLALSPSPEYIETTLAFLKSKYPN